MPVLSWYAALCACKAYRGDVYEGKGGFSDAGSIAHTVWLNIEDLFTHIFYSVSIIKT